VLFAGGEMLGDQYQVSRRQEVVRKHLRHDDRD